MALSFWVSYINSLISPTVLLWPIPEHSDKYLYQLSHMCDQELMLIHTHTHTQKHIYERETHETKMADFKLRSAQQTCTKLTHPHPLLPNYRAKMYSFLVPLVKNLPQDWTKPILTKGVSEWVGEWLTDCWALILQPIGTSHPTPPPPVLAVVRRCGRHRYKDVSWGSNHLPNEFSWNDNRFPPFSSKINEQILTLLKNTGRIISGIVIQCRGTLSASR